MACLVVINTSKSIQQTWMQLAQMSQAEVSMEAMVASIINGPLQYDQQGCVGYDQLTDMDELVFDYPEDRELYGAAYLSLMQGLSHELTRSGIYNRCESFVYRDLLAGDLLVELKGRR